MTNANFDRTSSRPTCNGRHLFIVHHLSTRGLCIIYHLSIICQPVAWPWPCYWIFTWLWRHTLPRAVPSVTPSFLTIHLMYNQPSADHMWGLGNPVLN